MSQTNKVNRSAFAAGITGVIAGREFNPGEVFIRRRRASDPDRPTFSLVVVSGDGGFLRKSIDGDAMVKVNPVLANNRVSERAEWVYANNLRYFTEARMAELSALDVKLREMQRQINKVWGGPPEQPEEPEENEEPRSGQRTFPLEETPPGVSRFIEIKLSKRRSLFDI